nr:trypsin-like peptidase domain-containing protein [Hasllibacter sp. MH4015]
MFEPEGAERFPGWEDVADAVVRVSCNGGSTGGGVLIGAGDLMITAGHVFFNEDGSQSTDRTNCVAIHPRGDVVTIRDDTIKSGGFAVPAALGTHFSVGVTAVDWAIVELSRAPHRAAPLPLAGRDELILYQGQPVLNISGPHDNFEVSGFLAQVCTYFGTPPTASALDENNRIYGRPAAPGDELRVARYDCDLGLGGSGSPIIGWYQGEPYVWGILTDSLRGQDRCERVQRTSCYSAGPLVTAMDMVPR